MTFIYIKHNNLYLMCMTKFNANAMVILNFLYRVVEVLEDYFTELVEESIRDNFVITYELLDEMMDFGYPQFTEPKILKEYIMVTEKHTFVQPPVALTNAVVLEGRGHRAQEERDSSWTSSRSSTSCARPMATSYVVRSSAVCA